MRSAARARQALIICARIAALPSCALLGDSAEALALDGRVVLKDAGTPVPDAEVSIVGRPGSVRTDGAGRFTWTPTPAPPFDVLVMLLGGHFVPVIRVSSLPIGPLTLEVAWTLTEAVTVTAGIAAGLEGAPGNGITMLTARDLGTRVPANLSQAVENVAGASTVSEGQSGVPALRGLARGRTLVLIDGARVTAERRVGPSASYLDPASIAAVEVSRGPGSVAYGSDAFGGVLHVRTRRATPGTPRRCDSSIPARTRTASRWAGSAAQPKAGPGWG